MAIVSLFASRKPAFTLPDITLALRHGFGLKNIEAAVKKYKGEMQISCSKNKEHYIFALDLLLPIKKE